MPTDDDLITRAKTGDATAWSELYTQNAGRLLVWLRYQPTGDPALGPEDVLSEAWLVAASKIADFTGTADAFAGWLFSIARHNSTNLRRRSLRRATTPSDVTEELVPSPVQDTLALDVVGDDAVRCMLAGLPGRERQVVTCIDVVGLDVAATAEALGISRTAVRVARHRGLARLRS